MANTQVYNAETVNNLATVFPRRNEHSYARGSAESLYLGLPGLRVYYPMSAHKVDADGLVYARDIACGYDAQLIDTSSIRFGWSGPNAVAELDGASYMEHPDDKQFDITATETYIIQPGLTIGAWVYLNSVSANNTAAFLSKWYFVDEFDEDGSYVLRRNPTGNAEFAFTTDGRTLGASQYESEEVMELDKWYFVCGVVEPGVRGAIYQNEKWTQYAPGLSVFDSAVPFRIGYYRWEGEEVYFDGMMAHAFICACGLSHTIVSSLYQLTRPLFYGT